MHRSIRCLMEHIVDYAGLFPPATLPMDDTVRNYARFLGGEPAWLVGRLIIPVARLDEFAGCFEAIIGRGDFAGEPWHISAVGAGNDDPSRFAQTLADELAACATLTRRFTGKLVIDAFECRLPRSLIEGADRDAIRRLAADASKALAGAKTPISASFEVAFAGDWEKTVPATIAALAETNAGGIPTGGQPIGVKIRTGGVEAHMFPSPQQVACLITACKHGRIAFKATAGLHHPVRHFNDSVQTRMHGFLNVFGGAVLLDNNKVTAQELVAILEDENAASFKFDVQGFVWRDHRVTCEEIGASRQRFATSFGSCSVDEPCDDLRALELI